MKKLLSILICFCIIMSTFVFVGITAFAYGGDCGDNVTWSLDKTSGLLTISGEGKMKNYTSSSGAPWTGSVNGTNLLPLIKNIVIEDGVTSVGDYAFSRCENITTVSISNTATSIGDYAFAYLYSLTQIDIPGSVKWIGYDAFYACERLSSVNLNSGLETISNSAFSHCSSLKSIVFPDSLTIIGESAFCPCPKLTNVEFGKGLKEIKSAAFNSTAIVNLDFPEGVTTIGSGAFRTCGSLISVTVPSSLKTIEATAFYYCNEDLTFYCNCDNIVSLRNYNGSYFKRISSHDYSELNFNETEHWYKCSRCDSTNGHTTHEFLNYVSNGDATCEDSATETAKCEQCDAIDVRTVENTALGHDFTILTYDETEHWYKCSRCDATSEHKSHEFLNYVSNDDATCEDNATETAKCESCEITHTKEKENSTLCHEYSLEWTIDIESTCTTSGEMSKHCVRYDECGARTDVITVPAKGHTESVWEIVLEATDTQSGIRRKICVDCKITLVTEYYEKHQHSFSSEITTEPTCENNGIETFYCQCGESYTQIILSKGHTIVTDKSVKATCTKTGLTQGSHCSVCNEVFVAQEVVESLAHKYKWVTTKKATYFAKGTSSYKCTVCGKVAKTKSIAKLVLKKPTFKLTGAKGKFTVKYTKVTGATGFEVRYKLGSGKYKTVKVNTKKSISKVISKLKKGKYTVQVRAFVKSGKNTAYSSWASAKKVTVK